METEEIPFSVVYDPAQGTVSNFQWRPDPALYLAVMCGQFQLVVDEVTLVGGASNLNLNINVMVSGWKSIMGNPDKKPRRSSKKKSVKQLKGEISAAQLKRHIRQFEAQR